ADGAAPGPRAGPRRTAHPLARLRAPRAQAAPSPSRGTRGGRCPRTPRAGAPTPAGRAPPAPRTGWFRVGRKWTWASDAPSKDGGSAGGVALLEASAALLLHVQLNGSYRRRASRAGSRRLGCLGTGVGRRPV